MGVKVLLDKFLDSFPESLEKYWVENRNEIYLQVESKEARTICLYLYESMDFPLISMFACDERELSGKYFVHYVFANRVNGILLTVRSKIDAENPQYESITDRVHGAALYEREIKDMFGLEPVGHPDAKPLAFHGNWPEENFPLRKDFDGHKRPPHANRQIRFNNVGGEGVFEIPVGPVHAGIIEPGHFRFSVAGEPIINLEAQLGFVHKGIEKLAEGSSIERGLYISERISGDETFSNSLAYCLAVEKIAGVTVPKRGEYTRVFFAEFERLTAHLGDLAGVCLDAAYGFACYQFRMMRSWTYQMADELCGMRFLRSVNQPGGIRKDFIRGKGKSFTEQLEKIDRELSDTWEIVRGNSMFADRVEHTGIVMTVVAKDLNAVGPAARSTGWDFDVRRDFPYSAYGELKFKIPSYFDGDVNARMKIKLKECHESISIMLQVIEVLTAMEETADEQAREYNVSIGSLPSYKMAYGMTESPRGENIHFLMTGENNTIYRYKVRTPSFCNWPIVCHAVQSNIVPDFPLINKSFNLSYAGNDL
jgi:Ni,Fe-hydrogenase III large subunit/Ni,Fe-hydrogenase III component G